MLISKTGQFSPRAALYYPNTNDKRYIPINKISQKLNISFHFLTELLRTLTETGNMISFEKPLGGIMHSKNPQQISLYKIILTTDRVNNFRIFNLSNKPNQTNLGHYIVYQKFGYIIMLIILVGINLQADSGVGCHSKIQPNIVADWKLSNNSEDEVSYETCHGSDHQPDTDFSCAVMPKPEGYEYNFPDLLTFYNAPTLVEQKHFKMHLKHRMRAFQGTYHANPDYALWYEWSEMVRDLTEIKTLAEDLRRNLN